MTVVFETGYSLPSGDMPLKHPRILHEGVRHRVRTVTASNELTNYPGLAANNDSTVDKWRPFENALEDATDLSESTWTATNLTVGSAGTRLTETTATGEHSIEQTHTLVAEETVVAVWVTRETAAGVKIEVEDSGSTLYSTSCSLETEEIYGQINSEAELIWLGEDDFLLKFVATFGAAGAGTVKISLLDSTGTSYYTGDTDNTLAVHEVFLHTATATLQFDLFTALSSDIFCIGGHNLWSSGATVTIEHDSDEDDTWTEVAEISMLDDSPIMCIYGEITSRRWRVHVSGGVLPQISVARLGTALQFERPFYAGFTPSRWSRQTEVLGNMSGNGKLLGRSRKHTLLTVEYPFTNLTEPWVRANLEGPTGFIQASEAAGFFAAWRPGETQDVDYFINCSVTPPSAIGNINRHSFSFSGEVDSYE